MKKIDKLIEPSSLDTELTIRDLLQNKEVKTFIDEHQLKINDIRDHLVIFLAYLDKKEKCFNCHSLTSCTQNIKGQRPILSLEEREVILLYQNCSFQETYLANKAHRENLKTLSVNAQKDIILEDIYQNAARKDLLAHIIEFIKYYKTEEKMKGIYAYGPFGSGKTYIMNYLALQMAKKGYRVYFAYYPDLVRKIKSYIGTPLFEQTIEEIKNVDILILDDLGGESNTAFIRDEVLGPILQARIDHNKPLFVTSNLSGNDLREHLAESKTNLDRIKASRIYERIRSLADFISLNDQNYRM